MTEAEAPPAPRPLWAINQMTAMEFSAFFAGVFEHSPWVAAKASLERPFPSKSAVLGAMAKAVAGAPEDDQLALLRAHPMLGGQAAKRGEVTASSRAEQAGLGLDRLEGDEEAAFAAMNLAYCSARRAGSSRHSSRPVPSVRLHPRCRAAGGSRRGHKDCELPLGRLDR
jgi:hypothetical protein